MPGDALVDGRGRVRHRPHDRDGLGEVRLDRRGRDRGRHGEDGLLRCQQPADLAEQRLEVLRLDRDDDERRSRDRLGVRERADDAVPLDQLVDALLPAAGDHDLLRVAPAVGEQAREQRLADLAGAEDRDPPRVDGHARSLREGVCEKPEHEGVEQLRPLEARDVRRARDRLEPRVGDLRRERAPDRSASRRSPPRPRRRASARAPRRAAPRCQARAAPRRPPPSTAPGARARAAASPRPWRGRRDRRRRAAGAGRRPTSAG